MNKGDFVGYEYQMIITVPLIQLVVVVVVVVRVVDNNKSNDNNDDNNSNRKKNSSSSSSSSSTHDIAHPNSRLIQTHISLHII